MIITPGAQFSYSYSINKKTKLSTVCCVGVLCTVAVGGFLLFSFIARSTSLFLLLIRSTSEVLALAPPPLEILVTTIYCAEVL